MMSIYRFTVQVILNINHKRFRSLNSVNMAMWGKGNVV